MRRHCRIIATTTFAFWAATLSASANEIYLAQNATGSNSGVDCANAKTIAFFNSPANWGAASNQIGPGTVVHLCGLIAAPANSTGLIFQGSGTSGSPITLRFETDAVLESPYWASSVAGTSAGAITLGVGHAWLVIDGGGNGLIRNTGNGSSLANKVASTGISGFNCSNCTVKNLTIANLYVNVAGDGSLGDNSVVRALDVSGSNWSVHDNSIHDCGWCVVDFFAAGDTHTEIYRNDIFNMGHAVAFAPTSLAFCSAPCLLLHDNHIHDAANWTAPGCPFHNDGLHTFGF